MAKHFPLAVTDTTFSFARRKEKIAAEAAIDGIYAVRASSREEGLPSPCPGHDPVIPSLFPPVHFKLNCFKNVLFSFHAGHGFQDGFDCPAAA